MNLIVRIVILFIQFSKSSNSHFFVLCIDHSPFLDYSHHYLSHLFSLFFLFQAISILMWWYFLCQIFWDFTIAIFPHALIPRYMSCIICKINACKNIVNHWVEFISNVMSLLGILEKITSWENSSLTTQDSRGQMTRCGL